MMSAKEKLESMICTYVKDALGRHKEYAHQLLSRKAPLSQRIFYYSLKLSLSLLEFRRKTSLETGSVFSESFPMQAA